ncbi:ribonuclease H-like domain-containing protein [Tanacetum coccineum]
MEEASKRHAEQDERLKKFYQNTQTRQEAHDKIIQGLETKVKTLANEVEKRANNGKFEECKTICAEDGSPLYTPFYYSPQEIEYFSANSRFSDNEKQEIDNSGMVEALAALETTLKIKQEPKEEKQSVNYYVDPYEPPIPFPRRLEHHAKEALVHKTMESLKKIKLNRPLLKEIRQTDNYAKHMKDLVENKPRTEEDEEIRMNPRCSALLQNHLPHKEQDPGSFILPCSIRKLDFNNALADLGASFSIMPLSMYKRLGIGKHEPIDMVIEMADNTKCTLINS